MQEFLGLAYFAEVPAVLFDVQRGGPSTGMPTRTQQSDILACAWASHGDTKQILVFPRDPGEAFDFAATAFDLADRLQTPVFVMLDLDIGMNHSLTAPFTWDDARQARPRQGDDARRSCGGSRLRPLSDVDGDGIAWRTYPGTHPTRGAYFARGTTRDPYARYTEDGAVYVANMQRLLRKFETAKSYVPGPIVQQAARSTRTGVIH